MLDSFSTLIFCKRYYYSPPPQKGIDKAPCVYSFFLTP